MTTPGELVSLILRQGPSNNIGVVGTIADSIDNSGSFEWDIPANLPSGNNYAIQIIVGPASNVSNVGPDAYNFTPLLPLVNNSTNIPSSNSTTTASSASASSTSAASAASSQASSEAASSSGTATTETGGTTTTVETGATRTAPGGASGTTQSASSSATHASSAAKIDASLIGGHGFFALIIAVAVGVVASL